MKENFDRVLAATGKSQVRLNEHVTSTNVFPIPTHYFKNGKF